MSVTVFTTGSVEDAKGEDGVAVLRIDCDASGSAGPYRRYELPEGGRIETNGAVSESFGRGGSVLEVIGLGELRLRGAEDELKKEAGGSCRMTYDEHGLIVCDQGSCSGSCVLKTWFIFSWCSCR